MLVSFCNTYIHDMIWKLHFILKFENSLAKSYLQLTYENHLIILGRFWDLFLHNDHFSMQRGWLKRKDMCFFFIMGIPREDIVFILKWFYVCNKTHSICHFQKPFICWNMWRRNPDWTFNYFSWSHSILFCQGIKRSGSSVLISGEFPMVFALQFEYPIHCLIYLISDNPCVQILNGAWNLLHSILCGCHVKSILVLHCTIHHPPPPPPHPPPPSLYSL